jgi:organic radical activating enzyme
MIYKYAHPEYFFDWEKPNFKQASGNLILWGAGRIGGMAAHCLKELGIDFICFVDAAHDKWGMEYCGHSIISPAQLQDNYPDVVIAVSTSFSTAYNDAKSLGYEKVYDCSSLFMEIDFNRYDFWMDIKYAIRNVEQYLASIRFNCIGDNAEDQIFLNITSKCSLRCKNCSLFIPYIMQPCHYPAQEIITDFLKVLNGLGHARIVNLYGGEPFLHPELPDLIRMLKAEPRIDRISAITNATIIPSKDLITAMKDEPRFLLRISNYGEISIIVKELLEILKKENIAFEVANYTYWDKTSQIRFVKSTKNELSNRFKACVSCNVLFIMNRNVYLCSTGSALCTAEVFPKSSTNCLDLTQDYTEDELKDALYAFTNRRRTGEFMDACNYCNGNHCSQLENKVPVAEQAVELLTLPKLF